MFAQSFINHQCANGKSNNDENDATVDVAPQQWNIQCPVNSVYTTVTKYRMQWIIYWPATNFRQYIMFILYLSYPRYSICLDYVREHDFGGACGLLPISIYPKIEQYIIYYTMCYIRNDQKSLFSQIKNILVGRKIIVVSLRHIVSVSIV